MIKQMWDKMAERFGAAARLGLLLGGVAILGTTAVLGYWLLKTDYQVLFSELSPQDTAAMAAELDRQKIPYTLSDQENGAAAILVDRKEVHRTRLKLMGKDIPLHGTVGFELFNTTDFGMTEFAQKINYQRALQGELTRTILSLAEIKDARVLLALPEQGLFKQAANKPKASVTLTMKTGQLLRAEQVGGIQRLVASAVPGILAQDVTIVDHSGIALTRSNEGEGEIGISAGFGHLDLKRETERYLARKAAEALDKALGSGVAYATVDVQLNLDRVQSSTDEVLGTPQKSGEATVGVKVRERESTRDSEPSPTAKPGTQTGAGSRQNEVEYAVGRRVEQVVTQPGGVRQVQVAVGVHRSLNTEQRDQIRQMVSAAVGASPERGDVVVVHSVETIAQPRVPQTSGAPPLNAKIAEAAKVQASPSPHPADPDSHLESPWSNGLGSLMLAGFGLLIVLATVASFLRRQGARELTEVQREELLGRIRAWMDSGQKGQPR